jgi:hypothetical protein
MSIGTKRKHSDDEDSDLNSERQSALKKTKLDASSSVVSLPCNQLAAIHQ